MKNKIDIIVTSADDMLLNDFPYMKHLINTKDLLPTNIRLAADKNSGKIIKAIALLDNNSEVSEIRTIDGDTIVSYIDNNVEITTFKTSELYQHHLEEKKH